MARGGTLLKDVAVRVVRESDGDLTHDSLTSLGLWHEEAVVLGQLLEHMGCAERSGPRRRRVLTVSVADAVARLAELPGDLLVRPEPDVGREYTVLRDPHRVYADGDVLTETFLGDLVRSGSNLVDGLELRSCGATFRVYKGVVYTIVDDEMMPPM